ncbi:MULTISPECIES: TetR/AcrR family transcriptional regulator [unclassified Nocardia]|uniref:TetR/AcrR family transcriptional regulator n=1 Tax=unclassified Nocardia TaxID=2637762 RepID=UPI001CE422CC|nr:MULTISPECIES: TetR/AcrR family transcriptional regulator [unclassified Nocardia]
MEAKSGKTAEARPPELIWDRMIQQNREPRQALSREQIVRVALDIADSEGLQAVSMRRIAAKLGTTAMSLYRHVSDKEDLLDLLVDEVYGETELPERPSSDWRADLRLFARRTRTVLLRHTWFASVAATRPPLGPNALRHLEFSLSVIDGLGPDIGRLAGVLAAINSYVMGFVLGELAEEETRRRGGLSEEQWRATVGPYVERVVASGRYPTFNRFVTEAGDLNGTENFEFGLDCLLDGIAARLHTPGA